PNFRRPRPIGCIHIGADRETTFLHRIRYELHSVSVQGYATFRQQLGLGVSQMKGVRGLVVFFEDGQQREFKLTNETWQFVFCLMKWIALFYPDHEKIELLRAEKWAALTAGRPHAERHMTAPIEKSRRPRTAA